MNACSAVTCAQIRRDENRLGFNAMEVPSIDLRARDFDVQRVLFGVVPRKFSDRGFLARGKLLFHGVRHLCRTVVNASMLKLRLRSKDQWVTRVGRTASYVGNRDEGMYPKNVRFRRTELVDGNFAAC